MNSLTCLLLHLTLNLLAHPVTHSPIHELTHSHTPQSNQKLTRQSKHSLTCLLLHVATNSLAHQVTHSPIHELTHSHTPQSNHKLTRPSNHRLASGALTSWLTQLLTKSRTHTLVLSTDTLNQPLSDSFKARDYRPYASVSSDSPSRGARERHAPSQINDSDLQAIRILDSVSHRNQWGRTDPICNVERTQRCGDRSICRWFGPAINHSTGDQTNIGIVSRSITQSLNHSTVHFTGKLEN
jgi:hypothetical protein